MEREKDGAMGSGGAREDGARPVDAGSREGGAVTLTEDEGRGGVTAARGFRAAGAAAGIHYQGRMDMALVCSDTLARVAGTFTTNVVRAAPVLRDERIVRERGQARAIVLNSGIANTCTGEEGVKANEEMARAVADALSVPADQVLTASTGIIGYQLPVDKVRAGARALASSLGNGRGSAKDAAQAILTSDTRPKEWAVRLSIGGKDVTIGGMAKGSGMIHPNMATMLSVVTTDCSISEELLQKAARGNVADTFNMISVDRDTSTNDTFLVMANGLAGNPEITEEGEDYERFRAALLDVMRNLAIMMARDGEGATKLLTVDVEGARTKEDAARLARSVASSNLVKTAIFGSDANWGRILCALGYSGADFDPGRVSVGIVGDEGELALVENGMAAAYSEEEATKILRAPDVRVIVRMGEGSAAATAWGCDLTYDYVKINGEYRS